MSGAQGGSVVLVVVEDGSVLLVVGLLVDVVDVLGVVDVVDVLELVVDEVVDVLVVEELVLVVVDVVELDEVVDVLVVVDVVLLVVDELLVLVVVDVVVVLDEVVDVLVVVVVETIGWHANCPASKSRDAIVVPATSEVPPPNARPHRRRPAWEAFWAPPARQVLGLGPRLENEAARRRRACPRCGGRMELIATIAGGPKNPCQDAPKGSKARSNNGLRPFIWVMLAQMARRSAKRLVCLLGMFCLSGPMPVGAIERYVSRRGSDAGNDCLSAASPCRTISHAVGQAATGDSINVAAGAYRDNVRIDQGTTLSFLGGWDSTFMQRDPRGTPSMIKGGSVNLPGFKGRDRVWTVLADNGASLSVSIDGFVLRGGKASTNFGVTGSDTDRLYYRSGGGLGVQAREHSSVVLAVSNTTVTKNRSTDAGGGVYVNAVDGSTVDASFTNVWIDQNKPKGSIGGLYGSVLGYAGSEPASVTLTLQNCVVAANKARTLSGGMYFVNVGPPGSSFAVDVVASTITGNIAVGPGTITPGSYTPGGGGIVLADGLAPLTLNLLDSIVWGNAATGAGVGDDVFEYDVYPGSSATLNVDHSDIGNVVLAGASFNDLGGNLDVAPGFADLPHLAAGSPLIDAGSCSGAPSTDFEGDPRPVGVSCDVGADEFVP